MNINNFLPFEETTKFIEQTGFSEKTPYVFIKILNNDNVEEIILTLANNIDTINGEVLCGAYIYEDFIDFIKEKYNYDLFVTPTLDGYEWCIFKSEQGVTHKYKSNIKYKNRSYALNIMFDFFIKNNLHKNYF